MQIIKCVIVSCKGLHKCSDLTRQTYYYDICPGLISMEYIGMNRYKLYYWNSLCEGF